MKVLIVIDSLRPGGKERRLVELLKGLVKKSQLQISLIVLSQNVHYKEVFDLDLELHFFERKFKKDPTIPLKIWKVAKAFNPDLIHSCEWMTSVYCTPVTWFCDAKFLNAMIANAPSEVKSFSDRWFRAKFTYPFSDVLLSNSWAGLNAYSAPKAKQRCINNGFNFDRLENLLPEAQIREKFNLKEDLVVGMIATNSHYNKDYKTVISAAIKLLEEGYRFNLFCIGEKTELLSEENFIPEAFKQNFIFAGKQNNVESLINVFDIKILSSYMEGISNAILESMASGKPVVATNAGGNPELIVDGETGFLVPIKDVMAHVEKLRTLLNSKETREKMGAAGKARIEQEFSISKMVDRTYQLYCEMLSDN
jgi:glycosyltransferase involved in cell wall biosynthesis